MEHDPPATPYKTSTRTSFGFITVRDRWPIILTQAIDAVCRSLPKIPASKASTIAEGKSLISAFAKLKYEIQHDRHMTAITPDGNPDIETYNAELLARGDGETGPKWFDVSWLYAECYLYRRLAAEMAQTENWKSFDVFREQKISTFKSSLAAVEELAKRYREIVTGLKKEGMSEEGRTEVEEELFKEMMEICLWGNATDLSLLTSLSYSDIQKLQGSSARKAAEQNILVNDLPAVYATLSAARASGKKERRVDIVLDNAGFELYVDLILAGFLLAANLATVVIFHPKNIPWFVSDVTPADFADLLNALQSPREFFTSTDEDDEERRADLSPAAEEDLKWLWSEWSTLHSEGQLVLRPNAFWTQPGSYWRLPFEAQTLFDDLRDSEAVVFKGDLNYRKLTGDVAWEATKSFKDAIGPLAGPAGIRVLALRTCKADVVVGLEEGRDEELRTVDGVLQTERRWVWSGKWAVVQWWDGAS